MGSGRGASVREKNITSPVCHAGSAGAPPASVEDCVPLPFQRLQLPSFDPLAALPLGELAVDVALLPVLILVFMLGQCDPRDGCNLNWWAQRWLKSKNPQFYIRAATLQKCGSELFLRFSVANLA